MSLIALRRHAGPVAALTLGAFLVSVLSAGRSFAQAPESSEPARMMSLQELESASRPAAGSTSGADQSEAVPGQGTGSTPATSQAPQNEVASSSSAADALHSTPSTTGTSSATRAPSSVSASSPVAATATANGVGTTPATTTRALPTGADKSGVTSKAISVPKGAGTIEGMGESFSAQLSTGIATFSVPFALPATRGDAKPSLGLSYSSSSGSGLAGMGWEVGVPFIARQTDRGIPKYGDQPAVSGDAEPAASVWHPEQDRFVFNGGQELVPICVVTPQRQCQGALTQVRILPGGSTPIDEVMPAWSEGWQYFRPRVEGSFLRFFWSPNHRTWRVQDKSGVTMELGVPLNEPLYRNALETNPDASSEIYKWHLVRQYDAYGAANPPEGAPAPVNVVVYRYRQDGGMAYLSDIFDTPPAQNPTTAGLSTYAHHTRLAYDTRTDPSVSYRSGWKIERRWRLSRVDVASKSFNGAASDARELVRRYHLSYDPAFHVSFLTQVQMEGRCAQPVLEQGDEGFDRATGCPPLPAMKFEYSHVKPFGTDGKPRSREIAGYEGFDARVQEIANSPDHSVDEALTDLFDINGDALPDVLVTASGLYRGPNNAPAHGVFFNGSQGQHRFGSAATMAVQRVRNADASTVELSNPNLAAFDIDGDASVDLVHMPAVQTYSIFRPELDGTTGQWSWSGREVATASKQNSKIDFGKDALDVQVVDVNFDGLVDVVRTTGTEMQTFMALGRYPGGTDQFGNADWTGAATARISNDPIRTCVLSSATPARFSDPDIKLGELNGDGIVDIVRIRKGAIIYWPGRGNGFWGTGRRNDCREGTFGAARHVSMGTSPQYTDIEGDSLRLDDVNGDGLDDLVQVNYDNVSVWLNVDGVSWTNRQILSGTPYSPSYANRVRLVDINGSGTRDILWGNAKKYRYIDLSGGERPGVLTKVDNGLGKTTTIEYTTSTAEMLAAASTGACTGRQWEGAWCSTAPVVLHLVKRVTESSGLQVAGVGSPSQVREYSYRNPYYDGRQREFRGFHRARMRQLGDENSPSDTTDSVFLLGNCADEDACDGVKQCGEPWRDNPREALKGLPVLTERFDDTGQYLSSDLTVYRLRHLYTGLDGRAVRHAFEIRKLQYFYDTGSTTPASGQSLKFRDLERACVETERTLGAVEAPPAEIVLPMRKQQGAAELRSEFVVDPFGNRVDAIAKGCTGGQVCAVADEVITTRTAPELVDPTSSGWIWRTTHSYVTGQASFGAAHGIKRKEVRTTFNPQGDPTHARAVLAGTVPLLRFHSGGGAFAPAPGESSQDNSSLLLSVQGYDTFGNPVSEAGVNGRCSSLGYDEQYKALPIRETVRAGAYDRALPVGACGAIQLHMTAMYDRGLGLVVQTTDMQDRVSRITYDGFGRLTTLTRPRPGPDPPMNPQDSNFIPSLSAAPSIKVSYFLPSDIGPGARHSMIRTETQDGADHDDATNYLESWSYIDGFGRTFVTLNEADPTTGEGPWIAGGLSVYDAKGALARKYLEHFSSASPNAFAFTTAPEEPSATVRYDAFGRQIAAYDLDGTVTLVSNYHALSTDHWDAADILSGEHGDTPASEHRDGHGRPFYAVERYNQNTEARATRTTYLPTGEVEVIKRLRFPGGIEIGSPVLPPDASAAAFIIRWMRYDTLGRMVFNTDANTSPDFVNDKDATLDNRRAWRYAYNNAGDLVGTSDARGCGVNYLYDAAGRLLSEDYSPCLAPLTGQEQDVTRHAPYSAPDTPGGLPSLGSGIGHEVVYLYDGSYGGALPAWAAVPSGYNSASATLKGRLFGVLDRGSANVLTYDGRGRVTRTDIRLAKPSAEVGLPAGASDDTLALRYAPRWYTQKTAYDAADREVAASTGAVTASVLGAPLPSGPLAGESSAVRTHYTRRGAVGTVDGSYGDLVRKVNRAPDGLIDLVVYGDAAVTSGNPGSSTEFAYDARRRLEQVATYRDPPPAWSNPGSSVPPPAPSGAPTSFQLLLQWDEFFYDVVGNPVQITDYRIADEWPDGAKPVHRVINYDNLYRVTRIDNLYEPVPAIDTWTPPFAADNAGSNPDSRRAEPSPQVSFDQRINWQGFSYDWLGNTSATDDDAHGFYDRSLGTITNGTFASGPYQLKSATNTGSGPRDGNLAAAYDVAGNLTRLNVRRNGECIGPAPAVCSQRFAYDWDEVGRLVRARRWDLPGTSLGLVTDPLPTALPDADLSYLYNAADGRVIKSAAVDGPDRHTAYVFGSLELRRATWESTGSPPVLDYTRSEDTEVPYLSANGQRLGRVVIEGTNDGEPRVGGSRLHVFLQIGDHLGSTSIVIDKATGELVERSTYQAYGGAETDYRPERWKNFREDYRFTGKEEDVEVGLQYFGKRYLNPLLNRWVSPDPLTIHTYKGDPNVYAYVNGQVLKATDPMGLDKKLAHAALAFASALGGQLGLDGSVVARVSAKVHLTINDAALQKRGSLAMYSPQAGGQMILSSASAQALMTFRFGSFDSSAWGAAEEIFHESAHFYVDQHMSAATKRLGREAFFGATLVARQSDEKVTGSRKITTMAEAADTFDEAAADFVGEVVRARLATLDQLEHLKAKGLLNATSLQGARGSFNAAVDPRNASSGQRVGGVLWYAEGQAPEVLGKVATEVLGAGALNQFDQVDAFRPYIDHVNAESAKTLEPAKK